MPIKAKLFLSFTILSGVFVGFWFFPDLGYISKNVVLIPVLCTFAFIAEIYELEVLPQHQFSVSIAIYLSAVYLGGIPLAVAVTLPAVLISEVIIRGLELPEGQTIKGLLERVAFNTAQILICVVAAGFVFRLIGGTVTPFQNVYQYFPPFIAFSVYIFLNTVLVSGIISLSQGESFLYQMRFILRKLHVQVLSLGVLSILIAVTYESSPWNLLLIAVVLFLVNASLKGYIQLRNQAKETFERIMDLLERRDPYTHDHSESVGVLTEAIAEEMRINPEKKENIVSAARVHDIGKLGIPDSILLKKGKLNDEEWKTMKDHPVLGADILSGLAIYQNSVEVVRHEHERWDGSGYPDGLSGKDIPLGSRIVAVADVWNALRTKRPYRGPMSKEEAKEEIKEMSGVKLDPEIVDVLLTVVDSEESSLV